MLTEVSIDFCIYIDAQRDVVWTRARECYMWDGGILGMCMHESKLVQKLVL